MTVVNIEINVAPATGSPVIVNGDEFENIELRKASDVNRYDNWHANRRQEVDRNDNRKSQTQQEIRELTRNIVNLAQGHATSSSDSEKAHKDSSGW